MNDTMSRLVFAFASMIALAAEAQTQVVSISPADGATAVAAPSNIVVTFDVPMNGATLTTQTAAGACSGTLQVSSDGFASCIRFSSATASTVGAVATITPAPAFAFGGAYRVRVRAAASSAAGVPLAADVTQATGFTTALDSVTCASGLVISQIYGGGGNTGAPFTNDFVELHNPTPAPIAVAGFSVQYGSATGSTWIAQSLSAGVVAPGGYYLIQEVSGGGTGVALPVPDFIGTINLSSSAGKVALASTVTTFPGSICPPASGVLDFVGYGVTANCFEGPGPTPAPSNTLSVQRLGAGASDTANNAIDFVAAAPAPRNSATAPLACTATANETGTAAELDFCTIQFPLSFNAVSGSTTPVIYAQVYHAGVTEPAGPSASIIAQIGYGPATANPQNQPGFTWLPAAFNQQAGNNDEYAASFTAPSAGTYAYGARFSLDGTNWTYCDTDGAGRNAGLDFSPAKLGVMTVTGGAGAPALVGAASRKAHGGAGTFDLTLAP